jgi:cell division protein FtsL
MADSLEERIRAIERLTQLFKVERAVYLTVTVLSLVMLIASAASLMIKDTAGSAELSALFGSSGLITYTAGRLLYMWKEAMRRLIPAAIDVGRKLSMATTFEEIAQRSRRWGWLSLLGALLVFLSMGYSYFTIHKLDQEVMLKNAEISDLEEQIQKKKSDIEELNAIIPKLIEKRNSAAALLLQILDIERQVIVGRSVNWERFREQFLLLPNGQRQEAVLMAILLAWKDIPFNIEGKRLLEGFSSSSFIRYVLHHVGINIRENRGEYLSEAFMRSFEKTQSTEPGDIVCYKGDIGNFCLLIISTDAEGKALAGIGTLETANPLGIYAMSSINVRKYPLVGYFKVPYKD